MNPGEYPQPLVRKTLVNAPAISGYVAARLRADDSIAPVISGSDTTVMVTFENVGNTLVGVKLRQTNDRSISGTRIDVITGVSLVPGGRKIVTSTAPFQSYLELYCDANGPSQVRMQIESLRKWNELGFDKVADATFYAPQLWQANPAFPAMTPLPASQPSTPSYPA